MDPSPRPDPEEINYYAPPEASLREGVNPGHELSAAEATRKKYLSHEASVQSIGTLQILGAVFFGVCSAAAVVMGFGNPDPGQLLVFIGVAVLYAAFAAGFAALGIGLVRLKKWARWVTVGLAGLQIAWLLLLGGLLVLNGDPYGPIGPGFGLLISGYILYLLVSARGTMVFSPEYRTIIDETPHIKYKTACLVKGCLAVIVVLIGLAAFAALMDFFSKNQ